MGRGQSEAIESNLLLGAELHEALRSRSRQLRTDAWARDTVDNMDAFERLAPESVVKLKDWLLGIVPESSSAQCTKRLLNVTASQADFTSLIDRLAASRLENEILPLIAKWPEAARKHVEHDFQRATAAIANGDDKAKQKHLEAINVGNNTMDAMHSASLPLLYTTTAVKQSATAMGGAATVYAAAWRQGTIDPELTEHAACREFDRLVRELRQSPLKL